MTFVGAAWRCERRRQTFDRQQMRGDASPMTRDELRLPPGAVEDDAEGLDVGDRAHVGNKVGKHHQQLKEGTIDG